MTSWVSKGWRLVAARPWISAAVVVIVVAGVVSGVVFTGGSSSAAAGGVTTTTRLVAASTGSVKESVSTTGTLSPADQDDVSFGSSAEITSVRVAQGDTVTKGQVLGTVDTVSLKADLAQAEATLAQAQSTVTDAQDSPSTTTTQLDADEAAVTSAHSQVTDAQTALTDATLRSPIAGTVAEVNVATGDTSSGGSAASGSATGSGSGSGGSGSGTAGTGGTSGTSGTAGSSTSSSSSSSGDFVVIGTKSWTASASVDDTEVGLIAKGDQVQITTDNVTGTVFGTVSSVSVLSAGSSGSATYPVTIAVTGSPAGLHDGASVTLSIIYKQVSNVLTVPTAAVHTAGGSSFVYVSTNGKKTKATVRTGVASGGSTQITSGLKSGQQVYVQTITRTGGATRTGTTTGGRAGGTGGGNFPGGGTFGGGNFPGGGTGGGNFGGGGRP